MTLSNILSDNITNKLKFKTFLLKKEKFYIKNLLNQITYLKRTDSINLSKKNFFISDNHRKMNLQNFTISYIINISFLKANTTVHISNIQGNSLLFYSAGSVKLNGKQKKRRRIAISKLISLILQKITFLEQKPIALHLNNVNFYKNLIINKLKQKLYIRVIKILNQTPYNGCRRKKLRRKKYTKQFK